MRNLHHVLTRVVCGNWSRQWLRNGNVVLATTASIFQVRRFDMPAPRNIEAIGCGGWDADGTLHWVGLDLDVGHGGISYSSLDAALADALRVHSHTRGACEVRLSRSGNGIHIRINLATPVADGQRQAPILAKMLVQVLGLRADPAPLGRQNFWFYARQTGLRGFELIAPSVGGWRPPAIMEPRIAIVAGRPPALRSSGNAPSSNTVLTLATRPPRLSWRTQDFLLHGAPQGERNHRTFIAACDLAGNGVPRNEAISILLPTAENIGITPREALATINSAYSKPRTPPRPR